MIDRTSLELLGVIINTIIIFLGFLRPVGIGKNDYFGKTKI
jgi:hypothetical protein